MMKKVYIFLVLLFLLAMAGCATADTTPVEQPTKVVDEVEPEMDDFSLAETLSDMADDEESDVEYLAHEFVLDRDAIARRAAELADFLQSGLDRADVERELGVDPVRILTRFDVTTSYRFDLMTVPGYEFVSDLQEPDFEGLRTGDVGIVVFASFNHLGVYEGRLGFFEVWYAGADGANHFGSHTPRGTTTSWHRIFPEVQPAYDIFMVYVARRAAELTDFFQIGLSRADVERELGVAPTRVYAAYCGRPTYRYDLLTAPGYEFIYEVDSYDHVGLRLGQVGIIVFVRYDEDDTVASYSARYVRADGIGQFDSLGRRGIIPWRFIIWE